MIITLSGENSFLLNQELIKLASDFESRHGDLAVQRIDAQETEYNKIHEALVALPFLVEQKLTIIYSPGTNKELTENLEKILQEIPDTNEVIFFEPKFDKRLSCYKILHKKTDFREFKSIDTSKLSQWVMNYAKTQEAKISQSDAHYLIDRLGSNQMMLANEIDKLSLYSNEINRQVINLLTEPSMQSTTFQLLEAAFARKTQKTIQLYKEQRLQKVEPQVIIGLLTWQLHAMAVVVSAGSRPVEEIVTKAKLKPYTITKTRSITRDMSLGSVANLINKLAEIDKKSKTQNYNLDEALMGYLLELSV
jgi:DNA polymerase-3 subunit delta